MSANVKITNPMKVITGPETRWSYANLWEPKSINGGTPKFSVSLIIPKSDAKTIDKVKAATSKLHPLNRRGCNSIKIRVRCQKLTEALIRCLGQFFYYSYQESPQYKGFAP